MTYTRRRAVSDDGVEYRDLNGNGRMEPYEDPRLSPEQRAEDLVQRLSLEEKAGLMFHSMLGVTAAGDYDAVSDMNHLTTRELVTGAFINHFNVHTLPSPKEAAEWQNALQELAEQTPHGIPVTLSSDPRHAFTENSALSFAAKHTSQWPEPLGLAAIGSPEVVRAFGQTVRSDYRALGLRAGLHPQIDLATEPRWGRQRGTFGQDARLSSELVAAYIEGMQGPSLGPDSVACTTKHFPGGGPQLDGEDPHYPDGREQVYPGGRFFEHLEPFEAAIAAGTAAMMPYYGMPVGLELDGQAIEEVGFSFNRQIITGLLRERLGFQGVIVTDWGLITDRELRGMPFPAKSWGVEHLSAIDLVAKLLEAGVDQLGGEQCPELIVDLVRSGRVSEDRINESARRILLQKFQLGLFDNPYVDPQGAIQIVGSPEARAAGHRAQAESVTVLVNGQSHSGAPVLPLAPGQRIYVEGIEAADASEYGTVVDLPAEADLAIIRLGSPYEPRSRYFNEAKFHRGSLDFPQEVVDRVRTIAEEVPLILDVSLERPAILTPFVDVAAAITATYGASASALLDALSGRIEPRGRLPFELPRSMEAVRRSRPDVASDTVGPLFPVRHGLSLRPLAPEEAVTVD